MGGGSPQPSPHPHPPCHHPRPYRISASGLEAERRGGIRSTSQRAPTLGLLPAEIAAGMSQVPRAQSVRAGQPLAGLARPSALSGRALV